MKNFFRIPLPEPRVDVLTFPVYGERICEKFGIGQDNLLGQGRHSRVYKIDAVNVLRIYPADISFKYVESLSHFYRNVDSADFDYALPEISEFGLDVDMVFSIEKNLGKSMTELIEHSGQQIKEQTATEYCAVVGKIQNLKYPDTSLYGEIIGDDPITSSSWSEYLWLRTDRQLTSAALDRLAQSVNGFTTLFSFWESRLRELPDPDPVLVHGDLYPGNLMVEDSGAISTVIDFSPMTVLGDKNLDVFVAAQQLVFSHLTREQVQRVSATLHEEHSMDPETFWIYQMFYHLFYASEPREARRLIAYQNLQILAENL